MAYCPYLKKFWLTVAITNQKEELVISTKQLNNQKKVRLTAAVTNNLRDLSQHRISLTRKKLYQSSFFVLGTAKQLFTVLCLVHCMSFLKAKTSACVFLYMYKYTIEKRELNYYVDEIVYTN